MVNCPECDAVIDVEEEELDEGESLICEECGAHLVVTDTNPLELELEDDDDDDDEDFDEDFDEDEDEDEYDEEEEEEDDEEDWR
jgi:alpha-aminoadipate carrier protein LysW